MALTLRFTKISGTHHTLEYVREDGSGETVKLESKSFLLHDFIHFAVETEARLRHSFYGLLEEGISYELLSEGRAMQGDNGELRHTEQVVGPMTSVVKGEGTARGLIDGLRNIYDANDEPLPKWVTEEFVGRVQKRMKEILGKWHDTPYKKTLELTFDVS